MKSLKIFTILSLYGFALFLEACISTNCSCPEIEFEFIDYAGFEVSFLAPEIDTNTNRVLEIELLADSIHFVVQNCRPANTLGLITTAYGCSCLPEGFRGDKFPILAIDIFANRPFKTGYQTRTNLNHIFEIVAPDEFGNPVFQIINEVNQFPRVFNFAERLTFRTEEIPDSTGMDVPYTFEIVVTRSDGSVLTVTTGEVRWL